MSRPFRFTAILFLAALGTTLAAFGGWRYARASAPVSGPIILISIDTLRADHLPAYGYHKGRTPALDALAADGVVFERAYSHAPQTLPAHAAVLSGRLPFETGVRDDVGFVIRNGERLLPQMLRDRGYATAGVVSAYVLRKETGINQGFDFFDAEMPSGPADISVGQLHRDGAKSEAIAEHWLTSNGSSRAFLFLHLYEPHAPYAPPDRFSELAPYDGEIAYADEIVARLVRYLKSHQLYDRSTIIVLSDHGEGLGDHGEQEHGLFVYDEVIHVPLIIKQESNAGAGRRVGDLVQHIDLVPTILDLAKAPAPGGLRGRSLKPLLDNSGSLTPASVYSESLYGRYRFGWSGLSALTDSRYQYIKAPDDELYDLRGDPKEAHNVAADHARVRQSLRERLDLLDAAAPVPTPLDLAGATRERLLALGYIVDRVDAAALDGETLPDPKDKRDIVERYRTAVDLAGQGKWSQAIPLLQQVLRTDPDLAGVWRQLAAFAARIDRHDEALSAYNHYIALAPAEPAGYLGAAAALIKLKKFDEARENAAVALDLAAGSSRGIRTAAHEMLARMALVRHDFDTAREEAAFAREADPALPLPLFIEGRILYDQGSYSDALPLFEQAIAALKTRTAPQIADLHFYTGDALVRLDRAGEAEAEFVEEMRRFPLNTRARAALATLYHADGRTDAAEEAVTDMIREVPTPEAYAAAVRLLTTFGDRRQAEAVRAEARRH